MHVCMYVCMYVYMYVCMYKRVPVEERTSYLKRHFDRDPKFPSLGLVYFAGDYNIQYGYACATAFLRKAETKWKKVK